MDTIRFNNILSLCKCPKTVRQETFFPLSFLLLYPMKFFSSLKKNCVGRQCFPKQGKPPKRQSPRFCDFPKKKQFQFSFPTDLATDMKLCSKNPQGNASKNYKVFQSRQVPFKCSFTFFLQTHWGLPSGAPDRHKMQINVQRLERRVV